MSESWSRAAGWKGVSPLVRRLHLRLVLELIFNRFVTYLPHNGARLALLRLLGGHAGPHTYLYGGSEVLAPAGVSIAGQVHIGRFCLLDGRGGLQIGRNVVIGGHSLLITADHDPQDPSFPGRIAPIVIEDRVWIGHRVIILKGVTLGRGCVVGAGSVVTKSVEPWNIVAGAPARLIGMRDSNQTYEMNYGPVWY